MLFRYAKYAIENFLEFLIFPYFNAQFYYGRDII